MIPYHEIVFNLPLASLVAQFIINIITTLGYPGIFLLMLLEGLLFPIPSEIVMAFGGYLAYSSQLPSEIGIPAFIILLLAGSLGNMVGAYLAYLLGDYGGIPLILRYGRYVMLDKGSIDWAQTWFGKYGNSSVFLTRLVPVFRTFISIPAGVAKMNRGHFLLFTLAGALIWDSILIYFGYLLGPNWNSIIDWFNKFTDVALVALAALIIWAVWSRVAKRNTTKKVE